MTWASRSPDVLTDKAMERIAPEINTMQRDLVWLVFRGLDFSLDPQPAYFPPASNRLRPRGEASKEMRVNVPIPKGVNAEHVHQLIHSIIRDGYDFYAFVRYPGHEEAV